MRYGLLVHQRPPGAAQRTQSHPGVRFQDAQAIEVDWAVLHPVPSSAPASTAAGASATEGPSASETSPAPASSVAPRLALLMVVGLGAGLRGLHLDVGLPEDIYVDAFKFVDEARRINETGRWSATAFQYPRLFTHCLVVLYRLLGIEGIYASHLAANALSAAAGSATVALGYFLARNWLTASASLLVALLIALCPVSVIQSRTASPDALMCCLMLAALVVALGSRGGRWASSVSGLLLGLAISAKFSALLFAPVLATAALLGIGGSGQDPHTAADRAGVWRRRLNTLGVGIVATLLALVGSTPHLLVHSDRYLERFLFESQIQRFGQIGRVQGSWSDYLFSQTPTWEMPWLSTSILGNHGWPLLVAGLLGPAVLLLAPRLKAVRRRSAALLVCLLVTVGVFFGTGRLKAIRFLLPLLPIVFILAVATLQEVHDWLAPRLHGQSRSEGSWTSRVFWLLAAGTLCAVPASRTGAFMAATSGPSTQALARDWVGANLDGTAPPMTALFSPFFVDSLMAADLLIMQLPNPGGRGYRLPEGVGWSPERDLIYGAGLVKSARAHEVDLIITNSYFDGGFSPVPENLYYFPNAVANYQDYRRELGRSATLVFSVEGISEGRLGPDIEIFALDKSSED
jgi:hypothetical protein